MSKLKVIITTSVMSLMLATSFTVVGKAGINGMKLNCGNKCAPHKEVSPSAKSASDLTFPQSK